MIENITETVAVAIVVGILGFRMLPATRRWAPRGRVAAVARHVQRGETSLIALTTEGYEVDSADHGAPDAPGSLKSPVGAPQPLPTSPRPRGGTALSLVRRNSSQHQIREDTQADVGLEMVTKVR